MFKSFCWSTSGQGPSGTLFLRSIPAILAAILSGLLLSVPFRTFDISFPAWFSLAPLFWLVARVPSRRLATACSCAFCLAWTGASFSFLIHLTAVGATALCIYTSMYYVAACLLIRPLARRGVMNAVFGTAALWALAELLRASVPVFGFPWLLLGHAMINDEHLRQGADILGVSGLSFIIVSVNAALAFALPAWLPQPCQPFTPKSAWKTMSLVGALLLGNVAYGKMRLDELLPRLQAGPPISVIQGNVAEKLDRTDAQLRWQLTRHLELHKMALAQTRGSTELSNDLNQSGQTTGEAPVLVCWAETMVPGAWDGDEWGVKFKMETARQHVPVLAGANYTASSGTGARSEDLCCYNTAFLLDGEGRELLQYHKRRLVPFGEYIPFKNWIPFLDSLRSVTRDQYTPGTQPSPVLAIAGYQISVNLCIEDIHPEIAREAADAGADAMINLTNDGWFYGTFGARAHLQSAAWRAIEVRRPMLRVTNTGLTTSIDPVGRITVLLPEETEGIAIARLIRIAPSPVVTSSRTLAMVLGEFGAAAIFLAVLCYCLLTVSND